MVNHLACKYCPECHNVLDSAFVDTGVRHLYWCETCQLSVEGYAKGFVARDQLGHEVTEARRKQGRILLAWCDECGEWMRLTYCSPPRSKTDSMVKQDEIPF